MVVNYKESSHFIELCFGTNLLFPGRNLYAYYVLSFHMFLFMYETYHNHVSHNSYYCVHRHVNA